MIDPEKRRAIYLLHQEGMGVREISRRIGVARNTVRGIIEQQGVMSPSMRSDKIRIDPELLRSLHEQCDGWIQRVHEKLLEEEAIEVKYSTLTRMLRELGISKPQKTRCDRVEDEPGAEFQHDTSPYRLDLGTERKVRLNASLLYLRYSKRRYLKFYRVFTRFKMKCFFHEALMFWGYSAPVCIIDNTNLARLRGTGKNAVIVPEMEQFARQYGFEFRCHEKGHANRKAGEERSFYTVESNFFPGRGFQSLEDLNAQALEWATVRMENRRAAKTGLIPAKLFEVERSDLLKLPGHLPAPYRFHQRDTDQYGFIAFDGNYYWAPGTRRDELRVLEYADRLAIYRSRERLAEYPLPADGIKNTRFSPEGMPPPRYQPKNRRQPTQEEEKRLRSMAEGVSDYLDFVLKPSGIERHRFIRELFALSHQMTSSLFIRSIERALRYRVSSLDTLRRIAVLLIHQPDQQFPCVEIDENFRDREAYLEGRLSEAPDFSPYQNMLEQNPEEDLEQQNE